MVQLQLTVTERQLPNPPQKDSVRQIKTSMTDEQLSTTGEQENVRSTNTVDRQLWTRLDAASDGQLYLYCGYGQEAVGGRINGENAGSMIS